MRDLGYAPIRKSFVRVCLCVGLSRDYYAGIKADLMRDPEGRGEKRVIKSSPEKICVYKSAFEHFMLDALWQIKLASLEV